MNILCCGNIGVKLYSASDKPLKTLSFSLADGADFRGAIPGAEVATDLATPDRQWERR